MAEREIETLIKNIREQLRDVQLKDGEIITHTEENVRFHFSPYRLTMEIRFPEGITNSN